MNNVVSIKSGKPIPVGPVRSLLRRWPRLCGIVLGALTFEIFIMTVSLAIGKFWQAMAVFHMSFAFIGACALLFILANKIYEGEV